MLSWFNYFSVATFSGSTENNMHFDFLWYLMNWWLHAFTTWCFFTQVSPPSSMSSLSAHSTTPASWGMRNIITLSQKISGKCTPKGEKPDTPTDTTPCSDSGKSTDIIPKSNKPVLTSEAVTKIIDRWQGQSQRLCFPVFYLVFPCFPMFYLVFQYISKFFYIFSWFSMFLVSFSSPHFSLLFFITPPLICLLLPFLLPVSFATSKRTLWLV